MRRVLIFDTTLRDGEQSPGASLSVEEKVEVAHQLARLGVDSIEAGFPIASPGDYEAVRRIAQEVAGPAIGGLARALDKDIVRAAEAVKPAKRPFIHTFIATSDIHMKYKLNKSRTEVLKMVRQAVGRAREFVEDVEFSAEDATRSGWDFLAEVFSTALEAGATRINVPDTVGYTTPGEFTDLIGFLRENVIGLERAILSVHCHNDLGLGVANSLAALKAGVDQVECTVNGIGERAGNAALEEIVMALRTRQDQYSCETGIQTEHIYRTSRLVSSLTGLAVQRNKAIVGENAFAHEAGIHQDGVLKQPLTYEIMTPESIGLHRSVLVLGKHSGRHAFADKLAELGYDVNQLDLEQAYESFIALSDKKKEVTDRDIEALVGSGIASIPESIQIEYLHVSSGNTTLPTATVRVRTAEKVKEEAACGDGPVDAAYRAIDRAVQAGVTLESYQLQGVTGGKDALGEVVVRICCGSDSYVGRGTSTDVIEASVRAYVQALNRAAYEGKLQIQGEPVADAAGGR